MEEFRYRTKDGSKITHKVLGNFMEGLNKKLDSQGIKGLVLQARIENYRN